MSQKPQNNCRYIARVTIQFETAFIVGSEGDLFFDDVFVSDANGLPALPGSSLAGILRHAWADAGYEGEFSIFGYQSGDKGCGSRLSVSWGCIHDSQDRPVEGIIPDAAVIANDKVLSEAKITTARDHVRIGHKGAAESGGKFDERSVSAGHRFSFELMLEGDTGDADNWNKLLSLLCSDSIRIGGKTRRGYGQFKVVKLRCACFDLTTEEGFSSFCALPVSLKEEARLADTVIAEMAPDSNQVTATLKLEPEGFWMIGGGFDGEVDMAPLKANRIVWKDGKGGVESNRAILTGSAVKGAIAHRTAFHYNRLTGVFADSGIDPQACTGTANKAVSVLFGFEKKDKTGQRGRVLISDLFIENPGVQKVLNHVSIDRFTGGARTLEGALFDEKPYYGGQAFLLNVSITEADRIQENTVRQAFAAALDDLAGGRLAIGAGAGRGNGYFTGKTTWNNAGTAWLAGGNQ